MSHKERDALLTALGGRSWILVFGGREYTNCGAVWAALDAVRAKHDRIVVIHGGCNCNEGDPEVGADYFAHEWAADRGVWEIPFPAEWAEHGKAAGPMRNRTMANLPHLVGAIGFPGGRGTANMEEECRKAGVKVWKPEG